MAASRRVFEIFASRVPWTIGQKEMREYFMQFGPVKKCMLPFDKETGFHKGLCWVSFAMEDSLNNALQKDSHVLEGSKIQVQKNLKVFVGSRTNKESEDI